MKILSTKILSPQIAEYAQARGLNLKCKNFIQIEPQPFTLENIAFEKYDAVIFTSINAIKIFFDVYKEKMQTQVFTLNQSSEKIIVLHCQRYSTFTNATEIAQTIVKNKLKKILHICGIQKLSIISDACLQHNIEYNSLEVYDTKLMPSAIDSKLFQGILFFSPSGVKSFFLKNTITHQKIAVMGQSTLTELKKHISPNTAVFVAKHASILSMIKFFCK